MSYFLTHRGWMENDLFARDGFSWKDAWLWLVEHAAFVDGKDVQRGQLKVTLRGLAKEWGWKEPRVRRFLIAAKTREMLAIDSRRTSDASADAPCTFITICNYEHFSPFRNGADAPADALPTRSRRAPDAQFKEGNKEEGKKDRILPETLPAESESPDTAQAPPKYAFAGKVVRLSPRDHAIWAKRYHAITDFDAALGSLDDYYAGLTAKELGNWYVRCSEALRKRHEEALRQRHPGAQPFQIGIG